MKFTWQIATSYVDEAERLLLENLESTCLRRPPLHPTAPTHQTIERKTIFELVKQCCEDGGRRAVASDIEYAAWWLESFAGDRDSVSVQDHEQLVWLAETMQEWSRNRDKTWKVGNNTVEGITKVKCKQCIAIAYDFLERC